MATNTSASLPDLTLEEQSILTVNTGDPGALITRVVIHLSQDVPELPEKISLLPPLLAYEPLT